MGAGCMALNEPDGLDWPPPPAVRAALALIDARERSNGVYDREVREHGVRVARTSASLASAVGWGRAACAWAGLAGRFHDVGKLDVPLDLLVKPGRLNASEMASVSDHAGLGACAITEALRGLECPGIPVLVDAAGMHHERMDGRGYGRVEGARIPPVARLVAVADVLDALTSDRAYRAGMSFHEAMDVMASPPFGRLAFDEDALRALEAMAPSLAVGHRDLAQAMHR